MKRVLKIIKEKLKVLREKWLKDMDRKYIRNVNG